jgi:Domain of unknown function (DUF4276)
MNLVVMTEEPSMKTTLEHLLRKLGIDPATVTIIAHQGKSDLEKSVPIKLRAWQVPGARFLILRDNDRGDCNERKAHLAGLVQNAGKSEVSKVRIVCQELEAWFLADISALQASGYVASGRQPRFARRDPDSISHPVHEMKKLRPGYGKGIGAAEIAPHLDPDNIRSASFRNTIQAIRELTDT